MEAVRNIGIFAHVDAGKTTLSEGLLAHAGAIRVRGSVDAGTAHTDTLGVERRRGISVKSKCVELHHRGCAIRLIDTPGHADFSAEVERSVWALDGAVLVVCAVEGVQPQTEVLFDCLRQQKIPVLFFLNKLDRAGADPEGALAQIRRLLTTNAVPADDMDAVTETLCDLDDELAEAYLSGEDLSPALIREKFAALANSGDVFPVLCGSALRDEGVAEVLDAIVDFLPEPADVGSFSGVVFATESNRSLGRGVWVRLYGGTLENRQSISIRDHFDPFTGEMTRKNVKITQIMDPSGAPVGRLGPGDIGVLYGLGDVEIGHILGDPSLLPRRVLPGSLRAPLITVQVIPEKPEQMTALRAACNALQDEDPLLKTTYIRTLNELHLQVMGTIQLEILADALRDHFDPFTGEMTRKNVKITQIMDPSGAPVGRLGPGDIGVLYGLGDVEIGHILGDPSLLPRRVQPGSLRAPLITVQVIPERAEQMTALRAACNALQDEDPLLKTTYIRALNELHLQVMGTIQLEILEDALRDRFDLSVTFGPPAILYRETIAEAAEGYVAYLAPKPCWAILRFRIEPGERDSGVQFTSQVPVRTIQAHYQNQVAQALPLALNQGRMGWPVTDVKITLLDGGEHKFHTHPLDFIVATPMAIQDGLARGGSKLLEPILAVRFLLPGDCVGRVMTDINAMRGETVDSFADGDRMVLNARIPVATSLDYAATLAAQTGGRGAMSVRLDGYRECPPDITATTPRRSVDPLDTSKYILAARSALEGGIFNLE